MDTFGSRVRKLRKGKGLTQKKLGELVGVSAPMVTQWEADLALPKTDNADRLCQVLATNWDYLKTGKGSPGVKSSASLYMVNEGASPIKSEPRSIPLILKQDALRHLSGENVPKSSNQAIDAWLMMTPNAIGDQVFAFKETSDGMSTRIESGGIVVIDASARDLAQNRHGIWAFEVNGGLIIGTPKETPRGLMLYFDNKSPGWEPIDVSRDDCVGRVVWYVPSWV